MGRKQNTRKQRRSPHIKSRLKQADRKENTAQQDGGPPVDERHASDRGS